MKKKFYAIVAAVLAVSMLAACGGKKETKAAEPAKSGEPEYVWKMALNSSAGDGAYDMGAYFADKIGEITNGRVKVDLYGGAALGSTAEVLEGMDAKVADCMVEGVNTLQPWSPSSNIDWFPYMYSGYEHWDKVWSGEIGQKIKDTVCEESGFALYGAGYRSPRVVTATYEMKDIEDFKGFKIRVPNIENALKTWEWIGATPTPMAMNEVYTALQQKTVDGQENPLADCKNYAFDEVCKFWVKTNHAYGTNVVIFSKKYIDTLPDDIKAAIKEAADYAGQQVTKDVFANNEAAEKALIEEGVKIIDVDFAKFRDYYDGYAEKNFPGLVDLSNEIKALDPAK